MQQPGQSLPTATTSFFPDAASSVDFSKAALDVLAQAQQIAAPSGSRPGARHVASVLFTQHAVGPRLAFATGCTDVPDLRSSLRLYAQMSSADASATASLEDDPEGYVRAARKRSAGSGQIDIGELVLALFDPQLGIVPIMARSGLSQQDAERLLPGAIKATKIYETSQATPATVLDSDGEGQRALIARLSKAMRTAQGRAADLTGSAASSSEEPQAPSDAGTATSSSSNPWSPENTLEEMATLAPRSARRAMAKNKALSKCGVDLVQQALAGGLDPVIGREAEISRALQILARRTKNNVCLVGAPGVGKTAVAEAIAQRIASGDVPPQLDKCRQVWSLDIGALLAGTGLRGDFEERLREVLEEIRSSKGEIILFVDEVHLLLGAGRSEGNNVDAANLLKPLLARGELRCIGATTVDEYQKLVAAKDAAFERRFQVLELKEPTPETACEMLAGLAPLYARHHGLDISRTVSDECVILSHKHIYGRTLPDKAIDVLDEACCVAVDAGAGELQEDHVKTVVDRWKRQSFQQGTYRQTMTRWLEDKTRSIFNSRSRL
eukprot:TRINITY_DN84286_c0_g1_i1.p1 TRINITY_DN84286_c0_g1~~TRINITY_DN84286_c0_g1_i1.p1  ORF type:complete len:554 (-),score=124.57 TRINITY_DN84286_c0_g1_i1:64-1725(-)